MKKLLILILLLIPPVQALTPWFIGTVTTGINPVATSNGAIADCIKINSPQPYGLVVVNPNPTPYYPPSPDRIYLGETVYFTLDSTNPNNAALIAQNGNNPTFTRSELCLPNGHLLEGVCSDGYPAVPNNYFGALEYTYLDATPGVTCSNHGMAFTLSTGPTVQQRAAFYHKKQPGTAIKPGTPGPGLNYNLNCATNKLSVTALSTSPTTPIRKVWIETAPPTSTIIATTNLCPGTGPCTVLAPIPAATDIHMYAIDSNRVYAVESVRC